MLSFYQKLAAKLNDGGPSAPETTTPAKQTNYSGTGAKAAPAQGAGPAGAKPVAGTTTPAGNAASSEGHDAPPPEGTDPLNINLFQSEQRMAIMAQACGVSITDFDIVLDEESNTVIIQATQKQPELPPLQVKEGEPAEKGRFLKQELKWSSFYRKVYLPASFDAGGTEASFTQGVLVIILPVKNPGAGKKLAVHEVFDAKK